MTAVLETSGLGKRYGRRWALADCTLAIPAGRVVGLVGPNGAGKTTLLQLAAGLLAPTAGTIAVLGERPAGTPAQLGRVGFVAQDTPTYAGLSVAGHLRMGGVAQPELGRRAGRAPDRAARPRPAAAGRVAVRRPARPARPHPGDRQAARAAAARRAGREPGPARPAGVPAGPDGDRRRARGQRRALLAPDRRPRAGVRLPRRAHRLPGAAGRGDRGAAGVASPPLRTPPGSRHATRRAGKSSRKATPTSRACCWCAPTTRSSTRPGRSGRSAWRTWCSPT